MNAKSKALGKKKLTYAERAQRSFGKSNPERTKREREKYETERGLR